MSISRKQLFTLFAANVIVWIAMNAQMTLLPVYALRLGADPAAIGNYLGFAFLAMAVAGLLAGWLSDRFQRRKTWLIAAVLLNIPATWLMSQVTSFGQLVIVTGIVYFLTAISFTMMGVLAGLSAGDAERGRVFGTLGMTGPIGAVVAGSISGVIVNRWGFPTLFLGAALCWILVLLVVLLVEDKIVAVPDSQAVSASPARPALGGSFYLMLTANLLAFACGFISLLGRPLQMDGLGFDPEAIAGVVAIGGAVSIPLPFLLGRLSDRMSRYTVVAFCFLIGALGLFALAASTLLWHFAIASILLTAVGASIGISQALVTDLVPPKSLGVALSLYTSSLTLGGVLGLTSTGNAIQSFGLPATYIAGAALTLVAIGLLLRVQSGHRRRRALA